MRALVREAGRVQLLDVPEPTVRNADDVIVRVLVAGICRTDLYVAAGRIASTEPITLGHELCGRVIACGAEARIAIGTLVAVDPRIDGGFLGVTQHGAFAELVRVPAANVLALPEIDPRAGAYVEPVAAALAVPKVLAGNALNAELAGTRVGLIGRDRFAELIAAVLRIEGCVVERQGPFDIAVETTGTPAELAALCEALRPNGTLIVKSRTPEPVALPLAVIVDKQLVVRGARYGSFARAALLVSSDALELDALLGDSFALAQWETAFARARAGEATKLFFRMDDDPCAA